MPQSEQQQSSTQLARREQPAAMVEWNPMDLSPAWLGNVFAQSNYFENVRAAAQAIVKVIAGRELGFPPVASMQGIYFIKGKLSMSANLMAAAIKRYDKGRYNYKLLKHNDKECEIEFFEKIDGKRESIGTSRFAIEDAKRQGTQNMEKYPKNMLFARAMSNGAKWYCADVFGGPVYTPEELGAVIDVHGQPVVSTAQAGTGEVPAELLEPNGLQEGIEAQASMTIEDLNGLSSAPPPESNRATKETSLHPETPPKRERRGATVRA